MRLLTGAAFLLLGFSLVGCDEDKKKDASSSEFIQPENTKTVVRYDRTPAEQAKTEPAAVEAKQAADAGGAPDSDHGRVTFDGDKKRTDLSADPGAVFAGNGNRDAKPKVAYTAPASANSLAVKEPPSPSPSSVMPRKTAPASRPARNANEPGSGDLRDAVADQKTNASASADKGGCPDGMSKIEGYCIDKYEGSLEEGGKAWPHNQRLDPGKTYKAVSKAGVYPQAYISGDEAAAACRNSGKRLCSIKEWVKACQGPMKTQYPYGADWQAGACSEYDHKDHSGHRSAMHRLFGDNASYTYGPMNDPRIDALPETVAPSGKFSKCTNAYGVYDMVGNVHEWVSDHAGANGVFKGGYFEDTHLNGDGCRYSTTAHATSYHDYSTGFRCCSDPS